MLSSSSDASHSCEVSTLALAAGSTLPFPVTAGTCSSPFSLALSDALSSVCVDVDPANNALIRKALDQGYRIRLYRPEDDASVRTIFEDGMGSYAHSMRGVQYLLPRERARDPWSPPSDKVGQEILPFPPETPAETAEREAYLASCLAAYREYTEWSLQDRALSDIANYWDHSERCVFLVCEAPTGAIAGTVAFEPVRRDGGFYADAMADHCARLSRVAAGDAAPAPLPPTAPEWAWGERDCARVFAKLAENSKQLQEQQQEQEQEQTSSQPLPPGLLPLPEDLWEKCAPRSYVPAQALGPYDEAELRRVSVAREHRGTGAAQLLIFTALEAAKHVFGYHAVHLSTAETMPSAVRIYEKCRFNVVYSRLVSGESKWPCINFRWPLGEIGRQLGPLRDTPASSFYII